MTPGRPGALAEALPALLTAVKVRDRGLEGRTGSS